MGIRKYKNNFLQFSDRIGYNIDESMLGNIDVRAYNTFDFFPEMAMFYASYTITKTFQRKTTAPKFIKNSLCFFFKNVFEDRNTNDKIKKEPPVVCVFPSTHSHISHFEANINREMVSVFIDIDYLKSFLRKDEAQFQFLFQKRNDFWIEEIITDDIVQTVNEIIKKDTPQILEDYFYKLKILELVYHLFKSLNNREKSDHTRINKREMKSIYKVRDQILSSLSQFTPISKLKKIAGMNEIKMRSIFTQVFGMGLYDYFQFFRMKEAARLLRDEKLSVSEVGYQMGFENLSHFTRVFEKHIGKKPKKYSSEFM